jgi:hypothetical protein
MNFLVGFRHNAKSVPQAPENPAQQDYRHHGQPDRLGPGGGRQGQAGEAKKERGEGGLGHQVRQG